MGDGQHLMAGSPLGLFSLSRNVLDQVFLELTPPALAHAAVASCEFQFMAEVSINLQAKRRGVSQQEGESIWTLLRFMTSGSGSRIRAGDGHTAALTADGELWTWGQGDDGQLGQSTTRSHTKPQRILALTGMRVIQVSAGFTQTVVITLDGRLFSFGRGLQGQLGHGNEENETTPRLVEGLVGCQVVHAATGARHTAAVTYNGEVWTFGYGGYGRLGHGNHQNEATPKKVEGALVGRRVTRAICGLDFTVALCAGKSSGLFRSGSMFGKMSTVFSFGLGLMGRLGHGIESNEMRPRLLEGLVGKQVDQVACGYNHTVVGTRDGKVFTFGRGLQGQLGHGKETNELRPRIVQTLAAHKVVQVAAGARHTAVVTDKGQVWTFGYGGYGRLGHNSVERELRPRIVKALGGMHVAQITAGGGHTAFLTDRGEILTCGNGGSGKLGHGSDLPEMEPKMVDGLTGWVGWGQKRKGTSPTNTPALAAHNTACTPVMSPYCHPSNGSAAIEPCVL